jgi:hypothetical protein
MVQTVTLDEVEAACANREFIVRDTLTICVVTMPNGFHVVGTSGCADPAKFNKEFGEKLALDKAKDQVWMLLGYVLKQKLHDEPSN